MGESGRGGTKTYISVLVSAVATKTNTHPLSHLTVLYSPAHRPTSRPPSCPHPPVFPHDRSLVCFSAHFLVRLPARPPSCPLARPFVRLPALLSACPSACPPFSLAVYLPAYSPAHPPFSLAVCLPAYSPAQPPFSLAVCLPARLRDRLGDTVRSTLMTVNNNQYLMI